MFRVGLTGGIASGKTTVCRYFSELGIDIFDADIIARELVKVGMPCYQQIIQQFGLSFLLTDKTLDRAKLRALIFSDPTAKKTLEDILHPHIEQELISQSKLSQSAYCILSIPLLAESKARYPLERILVINTSAEQQLERLRERDNLSVDDALSIITQQASHPDRKAIADDILENDSNTNTLKKQVSILHQKYLQLAKNAAAVAS